MLACRGLQPWTATRGKEVFVNNPTHTSRSSRSPWVIAATLAACFGPLLAVSTLAAQTPGPRDRHAIRFERPRTVGSRYRIEVSGEKTMRMEQRGAAAPVRDERTVVRMVAVERVLAVNALGSPTTSEYTIETFEVERAGAQITPLARGTVVVVERATTPEGSARITVGGAPVAAEIAEALGVVVSRKVSAISDDEVFGSTTPRRVGERWNINDAVAERELAAAGLGEVQLRGQVRAVELVTVGTQPCLVLEASMTGRLSGIPSLPPSATFVNGSLETTHRGALPLDGTSRSPTVSMSMVLDTTFTVQAGPELQRFHMVVRESRTEQVTALP
jgi:hypothetical protein